MIKVGTDCSGIGAPEEALKNLGIPHRNIFACEKDKYARQTYKANHTCETMFEDLTTRRHQDIEPLDLYIAGYPCQAFSNAGLKKGENEARGTIFYSGYEFIKVNRPKVFILENVTGMLNVKGVNVLEKWLDLLAVTVNGQSKMFPNPNCLNYHCYWAVLNTLNYGLPQNRERVYIVGFLDDNIDFGFPKPIPLDKKLKHCLEQTVDEKYYLSETMLTWLQSHSDKNKEKGHGINFMPLTENDIAKTVNARYYKMGVDDNYLKEKVLVSKEVRSDEAKAERRKTGSNSFRGKELEFTPQDFVNTLQTSPTNDNLIIIPEATKSGFAVADVGDSINIEFLNSTTRMGRVGKQIANTLDTGNNQVVVLPDYRIRKLTPRECARLQGFPDPFKFPVSDTQAYRQTGNSMSVYVVQAVIKNALKAVN